MHCSIWAWGRVLGLGLGVVSPYLTRPVRSLEEVLHHRRWRRTVVRAPLFSRHFAMTGWQAGAVTRAGGQGETAADMRRRGQQLRPRIIWSNEISALAGEDRGDRPREPDDGPTVA